MSAVRAIGTAPTATAAVAPPRLEAVDLLRGLVMIIMALDHTRDFLQWNASPGLTGLNFFADPTDLSQTNAALFLTRWITHFCAPTFMFLAGTAAFLSTVRGKSRGALAHFLVTRGLWLVLLEATVIRVAWSLAAAPDLQGRVLFPLWVISALGMSMIALAAVIYLPRWAIAVFGIAMIAGHNLFDGISPEAFGNLAPLWQLLHVRSSIALFGGWHAHLAYPLIPWIGVMATGYAFGALLLRPADERRRLLFGLGGALTVAFVLLRASNLYGDPSEWSVQSTTLFTVFSFLKTTKYPPSLLYLLMTLGPAIMALALFERWSGATARFFLVFGRVPLFYYVLHLYLLHVLVLLLIKYTSFAGFELAMTYFVWITGVLLLYPVCRWFAGVKARRRDVWLSYL